MAIRSPMPTPWAPSPRAVERVKNPLPPPTVCPICGGKIRIAHHQEIYGRIFSSWPWAYRCLLCRAYVGMHPYTNIPLGTLANKTLRQARIKAKNLFINAVHMHFHGEKNEAYTWLAKQFGVEKEQCHFGWFTVDECRRAERLCRKLLISTGVLAR